MICKILLFIVNKNPVFIIGIFNKKVNFFPAESCPNQTANIKKHGKFNSIKKTPFWVQIDFVMYPTPRASPWGVRVECSNVTLLLDNR
jgi:hypothetical protein